MSKKLRKLIAEHGHRCHWCGCKVKYGEECPEQATIEHLVPKSDGGGGNDNLRVACFWCNQRRGSLSVEEWLRKLILFMKSNENS